MQAKLLLEKITAAGVVGAGGAGFPTAVKINNKAEVVIANCAECEPLLKVDKQLMENFSGQIVNGVKAVMQVSGAKKGYIALKAKNHKAHDAMTAAIGKLKSIEVFLLDNYYPAGDEQQIVYEITGKVVPLGGLPLDVGAIVCNTNTLVNISDAIEDKPVVSKFVTVTGGVKNPMTINVPIGTAVSKLIETAGGSTVGDDFAVILGGPCMGRIAKDKNEIITKTVGGVIVLPRDHPLIIKKTSPIEREIKTAKSVCCQCNQCTMMCPRYLLGLGTQPHKVMRAIAYGTSDSIENGELVFGCCDCGLCTYFACPMGLSPSRFIFSLKGKLAAKGIKPEKHVPGNTHSTRGLTKTPTQRLVTRLGLSGYESDAVMNTELLEVKEVNIPLKQHIGVPCEPVVKKGDMVLAGQLIAKPSEGKLGANIHATINGKVAKITNGIITIRQ